MITKDELGKLAKLLDSWYILHLDMIHWKPDVDQHSIDTDISNLREKHSEYYDILRKIQNETDNCRQSEL